MKQIIITQKMIVVANKLADKIGTLRNSITNGDGNIAGFLGEIIAMRIMHGKLSNITNEHSPYDYDLVLEDGRTVDVKTKRTTVAPLPHYECSVAAFNTTQNCDLYAFVRVHNDLNVGWFLGYMPKTEYFDKSNKLIKGQIDHSNNFTVKADCYNIKISDLHEYH